MVEGAQRRLTVIAVADVVGYSTLMERDASATRQRFQAIQSDLVEPALDAHHGRLVNTSGDAFLFEFPSVVDAVTAAVSIQRAVASHEAEQAQDRRIRFRIGINLGEVLVEGDDIHGDGVNVAARLQALADPGGILISGRVFEQLQEDVDVGYEFAGEQQVKNIERPVRTYRVLLDPNDAGKRPTAQSIKKRPLGLWAAAAALILVVIVGGVGWWWAQQPDFTPANPAKFAYQLPEKPSIAVLPFDNLTGDKDQDYIGDGLTENIIAVLSTSPDLFIIARNSSFTYKGKAVKVQQVSEELGVRYVLEGSVQRSGDKLRVTAQLIDAIDGKHLWAEVFDRELKDYFELQDDIAQKVFVEINVKVARGESARHVYRKFEDLEAYRLAKESDPHFQKFSREGNLEAERLGKEALKVEPESSWLISNMGWIHWQKVRIGITKNVKEDLAIARQYGKRSIAIDDRNDLGHTLLASLDLLSGKYQSAIAHAERALEIAPNAGYNVAIVGYIKSWSGQPKEAIELLKLAIRLEPYHWSWIPLVLTDSYAMTGQYAQARAVGEGMLASSEKDPQARKSALLWLAAISVFEGDLKQANSHANRLLELDPTASVSAARFLFRPIKDKAYLKRLFAALRKAGLPENPPGTKPKKPSIAVLPFANISDDKEQEYFADGMTDDLITDLSKVSGLIVIARNSVFTYKGRSVKVQEVAKDLNVTHVLEGSVRRAGGQVRINAQLIDAKTGAHLWSDRFDRAYEDIFKLQDEIASKIVAALKVTLTAEEITKLAHKPTTNLEAYETYLQARKAHFQFDDEGMMRALRLYAKAIELDPTFAAAYAGDAGLANYLMRGGQKRLFLKFGAARERSERSFTRALKLDPNNSEAFRVQASNYLLFKTRAEAIAVARKAVASVANDAVSHRSLALVLNADGQNAEAKREIDTALRLDPKLKAIDAATTGWIYYSIKDYEQAIRYYGITAERLPKVTRGHSGLAMSYAQLGRRADAKTALEKLLKVSPRQNLRLSAVWGQHMKMEVLDHWLEGLRKAGLPEWAYGYKADPANRLSGEEIKATFLGHRIKGRSGSGLEFDQTTSRSGDWVLKTPYFVLKGVFRVVGDEKCTRSDDLMFGRESCNPVYRNPAGSRAELNEYISPGIITVHEFSIVE